MLPKLVTKAHNAFVEGRQILDVALVANEAIDLILRSNKGAFMCKHDIEKAYDHVEWPFFCLVLEKTGFERKWIEWVIGKTPLGYPFEVTLFPLLLCHLLLQRSVVWDVWR